MENHCVSLPPPRDPEAACGEVLWLGQEGCDSPARVGGKAAALSRLSDRYSIPVGFCVPADRAPGLPSALGPRLERQVLAAYRRLGRLGQNRKPAVAVRSSATDEDGRRASLAGQLLTLLNVRGDAELLRSISRCRASNLSAEARAYRRDRGLTPDVPVAVLVQLQVPADISVVAFSVDPVTGDPRRLVINAHWGLGESLVDGTAHPDHVVVDRRSLHIVEQRVGSKRRMTVLQPRGTREVSVPRTLRDRLVLDEERILEIAKLVCSLEKAQGHPVDVECVARGKKLFLLQCRPITSLDEAGTGAFEGG